MKQRQAGVSHTQLGAVQLGSPERAWVRVTLQSADGTSEDLDLLADTGNPCAIIVCADALQRLNLGLTNGVSTNFGFLDGGRLRVRIPGLDFDEDLLAYGSDAVLEAARASHPDFAGTAGLPLLRLFEYGGNADSFWIRRND